MSALRACARGGVEGFSGVGGGGEDDWFGACAGDECGEHGGVGVADFAGAGSGVDGDEFVACGEDGYAGTDVDVEMRVSAGGGEGDLGGTELSACGELFVAAAGLRAFGDDVVAGVDFVRGARGGLLRRSFYVLEHNDAVGAGGDGCAGHDFPGGAGRQRAGGRFACVRGSCDGECRVRGGLCGAAGVTVAGGTRERGLIVFCWMGAARMRSRRVAQRDALGAGFFLPGDSSCVRGYEAAACS